MTPAREKLARECGWEQVSEYEWHRAETDGGLSVRIVSSSYFSTPAFAFEEVAPKLAAYPLAAVGVSSHEQGRWIGVITGVGKIAGAEVADTPHEALLLAAEKVVEAMK